MASSRPFIWSCDLPWPSPLYSDWIVEVAHIPIPNYDDDLELGNSNSNFEDNLEEMFNKVNGPNADAKQFYAHVEEGKQPLYPGSKKFFRLSFIIRLYSLKCINGIIVWIYWYIRAYQGSFPRGKHTLSFNTVKNIIRDLGLDYQKIHACPNHCMLYWGENETKNSCS